MPSTTTKAAGKAKAAHKQAKPAAPAGPPAVDVLLLKEVAADEDQLVSLAVIPEARAFVQQAENLQVAAQGLVNRDTLAWDAARAAETRAWDRQLEAQDRVAFFEAALGQLGLAEYTGVSSSPSGDLAAQEAQLDQTELADVAATVTVTDLARAEHDLAVDKRDVVVARAVVASSLTTLGLAQEALQSADSQVLLSERDVVMAVRWATQAGAAPTSPVEALVRLEGPLGLSKAARWRAQELAALATTTTSVAASPPAGTATGTTAPAPSTSTTGAPAGTTTTGPLAGGQSRPSTTAPLTTVASAGLVTADGPSILGPSLLSADEIEGWFTSTGSTAHLTVPFSQLVNDYLQAGQLTGVRADIAFAQSVVETGHFDFPAGGQLTPKYNNFAGIGACDSCKHGWKFPSAMAGVTAQERLLEGYATPRAEQVGFSSLAGPGVQDCCATWLALSGVWATNPDYGYEILAIYEEMLAWAIPQQLMTAGLLSPTEYAAEGLAQVSVGASALTEAAASAAASALRQAAESALEVAARAVVAGVAGTARAATPPAAAGPAGVAVTRAAQALLARA